MSSGFPRHDGRTFESSLTFDMRDDLDRQAYSKLLDTLMSWFEEAEESDEVLADEESGFRHFRLEDIEVACDIAEASKRSRIIFLTILSRDAEAEETEEHPYATRDENLLVQCVRCGETFGADSGGSGVTGGNNAFAGPVIDVDTGREYKYVGDTSGEERLAHKPCYEEYQVEQRAAENRSITEFTGGNS